MMTLQAAQRPGILFATPLLDRGLKPSGCHVNTGSARVTASTVQTVAFESSQPPPLPVRAPSYHTEPGALPA
eukprot:1891222-Rhodomonas_salina.4